MLLVDPMTCLVVAMYFEARSELPHNQVKVGEVIMNRVDSKHYRNTICGVVKQRKHFSFLNGKPKLTINYESEAWKTAVLLGDYVLRTKKRSTSACNYAHIGVNNYWTRTLQGKRSGLHVFYRGGC